MSELIEHNTHLHLYNSILDNTSEGIIIVDDHNKVIQINKACEDITGYNLVDVYGKDSRVFASDKTDISIFSVMLNNIKDNGYWIGELWNRHKNGNIYQIIAKIYKNTDEKTGEITYFAIFSDISTNDQINDELLHLAYHDPLTKLPNRLKLEAQLEYVINNSKRNNLQFAVLFLDLDDFKVINDTLGHSYGDNVLISFAEKFKNIIRTNDMIARVGGDEFILVLSDISNYLFIERVCTKILSLVNKPFNINSNHFSLGVSIGVAIYPENGTDIKSLLHNADAAMYHGKSKGKNHYEFFSTDMNKDLTAHIKKEEKLISAINEDEFIIHFQPEIDLNSNDVFSLEVLSRWNKNDNILMPSAFISDLEASSSIYDFEKLILKKSCMQLKKWHVTGTYSGSISVNISGKHLEHGSLYQVIVDTLKESNLEAKFLELEFNESAVMKISTKTLFTLNNLSLLGIKLVIDNYGKGFSSLNYLRESSISKLKIDKSYIDSLIEEKSDEDIVKSIIAMGSNMGLSVIAEGVEVSEQDEIVKRNACSRVQGYFYAKPMNCYEFEEWYKSFKVLKSK